ncbi:MAG: hypothetical protein P4L33_04055 [Capsulimonadaceae bacterium]|nr:hypothetical protein [Capsulimonadaceae bacterium]
MNQLLRDFVTDTLEAWGAQGSELAPGVYRYELPDGSTGLAAWYLGRPSGELLLTFDAERWEEGARIECVSANAPLVRRMQQYAEGRGVWAVATIDGADITGQEVGPLFYPYLLARFHACYRGVSTYDERKWLGVSLATGSLVRVAGNPFAAPNLIEGPPAIARRGPETLNPYDALQTLVDAWERDVSVRARRFASEADDAYRAEVEDAAHVLDGNDLVARMTMLGARYAPAVEIQLESALLLWR